MVTIRTERLMLREFEDTDCEAVYEYASEPEVVRYMDWGPDTEEDDKNFIKRAAINRKKRPRANYTLAIVLKSENKLIGGCGFSTCDPKNREASIGYVLNRSYWGRGYATETAKALLTFGFDKLKLHRIYATCDPANVASAHVMEKIGMKREGHLREHKWAKGKWRDSLLHAILEDEWKKSKANVRKSRRG